MTPSGTYPEYLLLKKGEKPPPDTHETGVRIYADENGALRAVQSDGTDAAISSGGSQPIQSSFALLSSADLLALDTTPVVLVEGVAGKVIAPFLVLARYFFASTPYDDQSGSYSLEVGDFGDSLFGNSVFSLCFGTADRLSGIPFLDSLDNADDPALGLGKAFQIGYVGGSIINGDGTLKVNTYYALVDVT